MLDRPFIWISPYGFVYSWEEVYHNKVEAFTDYLSLSDKTPFIHKLYWYHVINWN